MILIEENDNDVSNLSKRFHSEGDDHKPDQDERKVIDILVTNKAEKEVSNNGSFFMIIEKNSLEKIDSMTGRCLKFRQSVLRLKTHINHVALTIISTKAFDYVSLLVIIANSVFLAIQDPTAATDPPLFDVIDNVFLALYSFEMVLKIIGLGFLFNKNAYLKDYWNILDFIIVCTGYLSLLL